MSASAALAALGMRLDDRDVVDSTNRIAADAGRRAEPQGLVVRARTQTHGRGRQGRSWIAAAGDAVLVSFLRRPPLPPAEASRFTLAVGLVVRELAVQRGVDAWLKWPNDVLVGTSKLSGILCEMTPGSPPGLVIGVGLNLCATSLPGGLRAAGLGPDIDPDGVLVQLATGLVAVEAELVSGGWPDLRKRIAGAMAPMMGRSVAVDTGTGPRTVISTGLDHDGALLVRDPGAAGSPERLLAGDVHMGLEDL